ncbi:3-hydroxybutyryl-CoA dehydrogenase [Dethiobacter alkaliphilus]|uniref:3-hydroxybutyryl-CoA dehydrogenase n=1 Tax=Dethiobacter alkaliphilus TaxID=427926 RepID=UPI002225BD4D|nr:3-hydroxybutyryl-CoA dehydrogenase [Dethiobacter alkaliphilus]MCW3490354.1 3-hydroxybutyryl-CoA dehydrogenase [Dethiobacter alkaliphilus]
MSIQKIGVIGAGTMGSGIATVALDAGFAVVLQDVADEFIQRGKKSIASNLGRAVKKGKITQQQADDRLAKLTITTSLAEMQDVDVVIEAIFEDMAKKREIYAELDRICKPQTWFASNTSGLSITEMGAATNRPDRMVGMHFFNPVPVMKLVEVIRGDATSDEIFSAAMSLSQTLGKEPIAVNEAPLFVVNRILVPMLNEAVFVLQEGVASREDIDKGMQLGANHPIGPLALCDLVGLDVMLMVLDNLYAEMGDSKYRACPLLRKMVRAGRLGRKSGKGFYDYE